MMTKKANPIDVQVGSRIRMRRMMVSMSQMQLASHLGITFQQVQKYEKGVNRVGASRLLAISDILGVQPGFFFQNEDGPFLGDAEANTGQYSVKSLLTADGISLNKAFLKIKNPGLRQHILSLVKAIADREEAGAPGAAERTIRPGADKGRSSSWQQSRLSFSAKS
ncbi:helix-turn-helix domain-containing protein (plasmid) [Phyllobacteriaceae bacterium JZ32]